MHNILWSRLRHELMLERTTSSAARHSSIWPMDKVFGRSMTGRGPSVPEILEQAKYPPQWPFGPRDFQRSDETPDTRFYASPRIGVFHIDDQAVRAVTRFYEKVIARDADVLDLCSSWVSHMPESYKGRLTVLGISEPELAANAVAAERVVKDLNADPTLPFDDAQFDIVTNVVSVDYLTRPLEVFREMGRVLRPGGRAIMSFSNRCFPTKAIDIWCRTGNVEHVFIVGCYFHYSGVFERPIGHDLGSGMFGLGDPMFVVEATRRVKGEGGGSEPQGGL